MKIIIIGCGETGLSLANLVGEEYDVTIVEKDESRAKELANKTSALVIHGDGTDISILKEAGLESTDALIATTNDDTMNLMIAQIAKTENIRKIIPLVRSPKNEPLFTKLGVNSFVSVAGSNARAIKILLRTFGDARIIAQLGEGEVQIVQHVISEKSTLVGKKATLKNAAVATIYRKGELIIPKGDETLEKGDILLLAVKTKDLAGVIDLMKGE